MRKYSPNDDTAADTTLRTKAPTEEGKGKGTVGLCVRGGCEGVLGEIG